MPLCNKFGCRNQRAWFAPGGFCIGHQQIESLERQTETIKAQSKELARVRNVEAVESEYAQENGLSKYVPQLIWAGLFCFGIFKLSQWVTTLLHRPHLLDFPHNFFAYYYHYIFKFLFVFGGFLIETYIALWRTIRPLTQYDNLNLILALLAMPINLCGHLIVAFFVYKIVSKNIRVFGREFNRALLIPLFALLPATIWLSYTALEWILVWLFKK
jgi:hypothetical protein